ncbi:putative Ubiquitin-like domain superfamily [Helianthus annuus]|nr:putative Ubiquitin-like domain superfamily [Helianthus annuus]KAJ0774676.1 putative Ubiquitin-like domain superfamily [Helianthus annuus]
MLEISVESLCESVSSLKEKIAGQIEEAPPANKLKLRGDEGFLKDSLSLAYYNVARDVLLFLEW